MTVKHSKVEAGKVELRLDESQQKELVEVRLVGSDCCTWIQKHSNKCVIAHH